MKSAARIVMYLATLLAVVLAFGWPYVFGDDPASETFHVAAVATLLAWLGSVTAMLVARR